MLPVFWVGWKEAVYERVTVRLVRGLAGWYVYVLDNAYQLALWGHRCANKDKALQLYDMLVDKYARG